MAEAERPQGDHGPPDHRVHRRDPPLQQGAAGRFLPRVEAGDIVLIGATTENPSFEVNARCSRRSKVFVLHGLTRRGRGDPAAAPCGYRARLGNEPVTIDDDALMRSRCIRTADARSALNLLELSLAAAPSIDLRRPTSTSAASSRRSRSARCSTTRAAKSTTTSSRRC
jgi:putative ATPase